MTDIEITKACAEASGYDLTETDKGYWRVKDGNDVVGMIGEGPTILRKYEPLHNDAQSMALVKKHPSLGIMNDKEWFVTNGHVKAASRDLNRAICECVAKIQKYKKHE